MRVPDEFSRKNACQQVLQIKINHFDPSKGKRRKFMALILKQITPESFENTKVSLFKQGKDLKWQIRSGKDKTQYGD